MTPTTSLLMRYGITVIASAAALLLTILLGPLIQESPFMLFLAAVMLSVWYGGPGPGLLTSLFSALAITYFFLLPPYSLTLASLSALVRLGVFGVIAILITWLTAKLRSTQQQALSANQRFHDFVNDLDAVVWESDPTTFQFTFVSHYAEILLGYPAEQWLTERNFWVNHLHPDDRERTVNRCLKAASEGRDHDLEYRAIGRDGGVVWIRDIVRVRVDADGHVQQLCGVMIDITKAKEAEEELQRSYKELADIKFALDAASIVAITDPRGIIKNDHVRIDVEDTGIGIPASQQGLILDHFHQGRQDLTERSRGKGSWTDHCEVGGYAASWKHRF